MNATSFPAQAPASPGSSSPPPRDKKLAHHLHNLRLIMLSYGVDGLVLALFHLAGTIGWWPMLAYTTAGLTVSGITYTLIASGRTRQLRDPAIVIPHALGAQALQLGAMVLVPEVSFMFALLLFIVYCTLTLTWSVRRSIIAWAIVSGSTAVVLALANRPLHIPDGSLAEQLIALGFFVITLWRCMWIGSFNSHMTSLLRKQGQELAELTAKVDQMAHHDELTGLLNRRSLLAALHDEMQRAQRSGTPLCVALMDLDKFKTVNDTLGHLVGDRVLKVFAHTLSLHTRKSDRFGRYGGEEFLLLMTGTDANGAPVPIERMRDALRGAEWRAAAPALADAGGVTFSCGIAGLRAGDTIESLVQRADAALYQAKADGRNCTRVSA
ncbi:MAG: GGDEF domain-containing protein [Rhizobacter sp.]|nr:GGDEF domain-containing protein [Rhizobacter sp.]